jgi:crotonobetainyl-CoA:carnitine CoA-transferase CaiB-like acyl-CoA transferase
LLGPVRGVGLPLEFSGYSPRYRPAPGLGADVQDLLTELGYDDREIGRLAQAGAFGRR